MTTTANHPISGQLFTFSKKAEANRWADEVQAATGYRPQLVGVSDQPEPVPALEPGAVTVEGDGTGPVDPATVSLDPSNG